MCIKFTEWLKQIDGVSSGTSDYDNCSILVYGNILTVAAQPISVDQELVLNFCPICGEVLRL